MIITNLITVLVILLNVSASHAENVTRSFTIDEANRQFLMNGNPFRFISGQLDYFRTHHGSWRRRLHIMKAAGLNTVATYVDWSFHNPKPDLYYWTDMADLEEFIQLAMKENLFVILRPGPYICAERDNGGFPYWLLTKYDKNISLRAYNENYLNEVQKWYSQLMPKIRPYLYGNGGPIILVQVENIYGSLQACDKKYLEWLRDETLKYVEDKAVLFTADGHDEKSVRCGSIENVLAGLSLHATNDYMNYFDIVNKYSPKGPFIDAELYIGWFTHWGEKLAKSDINDFIEILRKMLADVRVNINFYMFSGGTNFGFTAGANKVKGKYMPDITSYDYDAPINEAGNPTEKYLTIKKELEKYFPVQNIPIPPIDAAQYYGHVKLQKTPIISIFGTTFLSDGVIVDNNPLTFEHLDQYSGLVLYRTKLPSASCKSCKLKINDIRDYALVYVDGIYQNHLSRQFQINSITINNGTILDILVENQGRINYGDLNDVKGILSNVLFDSKPLKYWTMIKYPLNDYVLINNHIENGKFGKNKNFLNEGPTIFYGEFEIANAKNIKNTYLDTRGWVKGIAFVNGFNLGRYWPVLGPQVTLFVPKDILKVGKNHVVLIEYLKAPENHSIVFTNVSNMMDCDN